MAGLGSPSESSTAVEDPPVTEETNEFVRHMEPDPIVRVEDDDDVPEVAEEPEPVPVKAKVEPEKAAVEDAETPVQEGDDNSPVEINPALQELLEQHARDLIAARQVVQPVQSAGYQPQVVQPPQTAQMQPEMAPPVQQLPDFVTDQQVNEIAEDPRKLNGVLQQVYQAAKRDAMFEMLPVIRTINEQQSRTDRMVNEFFTKNPDLVGVQSFVGKTCVEVQQAHPDWGIEKVLAEAAPEARRKIRKVREAIMANGNGKGNGAVSNQPSPVARGRTPAFADRTPSRKTNKPEQKGDTSVLEELNMMKGLR